MCHSIQEIPERHNLHGWAKRQDWNEIQEDVHWLKKEPE
jgi:hypothetical protein